MKIFTLLAWRNIWRNRRRTLIMILAIAFSIMASILMLAMGDGTHDAMLKNTIEIMSGYIQIHKTGYQDDPVIEKAFSIPFEILESLERNKEIKSFTTRLEVPVLAATETNSGGGILIGIDPLKENSVTSMNQKVIKGEILKEKDINSCLIGETLAKNLSLNTGEKLVVLGQSYDGSTGATKLTVKGIFKSGLEEIDRGVILTCLYDSQLLFRAENKVTSIVITTDYPRNVGNIVYYLKDKISDDYEILGWQELMPDMVQFLKIDNYMGYLLEGLLLLVVIFGVLSAIFSSILERTREFGVMLALGTKPDQIILLVLLETLIITTMGAGAGLITGLGITIYFLGHPVSLPESSQVATSSYGLTDNMIHFAIYPHKILILVLFLILVSFIFSLLPAWKASRLDPDKAIRNITQ